MSHAEALHVRHPAAGATEAITGFVSALRYASLSDEVRHYARRHLFWGCPRLHRPSSLLTAGHVLRRAGVVAGSSAAPNISRGSGRLTIRPDYA